MFDLLVALKNYIPYDKKERDDLINVISFIEKNENCFHRTNQKGHVTAGAFVCDQKGNILLNHHKIADMWFQFGGHCDGEDDVYSVAKREVEEETGINSFEIDSTQIFDLAINIIDFNAKKNEPEHLHYDINFMFVVDNHDFVVSDESVEIKWVTIDEALQLIDKRDYAMIRMVEKYKNFLKTKI